MIKQISANVVRVALAMMLAVGALSMTLLSGCANGAQTDLEDKAVPEVVAPLDPIAGAEPMQSLGGEEVTGEAE